MAIIKRPYSPQNEDEIKFETYRYYLECFKSHMLETYQDWYDFGLAVLDHTKTLQGGKTFDTDWIENFLKISWNTEYLLTVSFDDPELMRISNHWTPIQAYYAVYSSAEAASYVWDGEKALRHSKTLRKCTNIFIQRSLPPWNLAFTGAIGKGRNAQQPVNFPADIEIPHHLARRDVKPIQMIAKCLKAEHRHRVDDEWDKGSGVYKYQFDPGYTGSLHFLYRLRIKSNYRDVSTFISQVPPERIESFSNALVSITFWTLLYMEIIVTRRCGKRFLLDCAHKYLESNSNAYHLSSRLKFYHNEI